MKARFKDTKDPAVNVTTWVLLVTIVFSVAARLGTKLHLFKKLTLDDLLIVSSLAFGIGQSIAVSLAVASGYGKHYKEVSNAEADEIMKKLLAAALLYYTSLTLSKISLAFFIRSLTPSSKDKWLGRGIEAIICIWAILAIFGTAFQCQAPRWDIWNGQCFNILAWRYFVIIANIVTDLLIFSQAMILIANIQTTPKRRLLFAGIFLPRLFVVAATIVELAYVKKGTETDDPTFDMCEMTIIEVIIQCLSIVTACWGQLKPFLSWMRSNGLKLEGLDTSDWNYRMSARSQTRTKSRDYKSKLDRHEVVPLSSRGDQILVTQDWEIDSQSSRVHIVDTLTHPWIRDGHRSPDEVQ